MSRPCRSQSSLRLALPVIGALYAGAALAGDPAAPPDFSTTSQSGGLYVNLGGGLNLENSLHVTETPRLAPGSHNWQLNPGWSGLFGLGWAFGNGLRLEVDTNYTSNQISGVSGYGPDVRAGGLEQKVGGLVNLMYDFNLGLPVKPYVGLGVGGDLVGHDHVNLSQAGFFFPVRPGGGQGGDLAYTGVVGLSYPLSFLPGLSMTAEYRFLGLLDPQPTLRYGNYTDASPTPVSTGTVHFSGDYNQSVMLGLRFELFKPHDLLPNPTETSSGSAEPPPPITQSPVHTYLVFFDWDRADLTSRAREIVAEAASASTQVETTRIDVNGYTDLSGSAAYNKRLSLRRAETVQAELVRDGVSKDEIVIQGLGQSNPLIATAKGVREPQNRRVEIILH